ncbi:hypothetical protein HK102_001340 [Quaeritorhiza haematococci]|nr:hypothetical protein HK102_001340 [Quaeritorhiza haematococci]
MSGRVSTSRGKSAAKKPGQKHQNTIAFQPNKYSYIAQKIAATPIRGLCKRCRDILEWKKRMNKYKPLSQPKKCVSCERKAVTDAYHILCGKCATEQDVCAKCRQKEEIVDSDAPKSAAEILKEEQEKQNLLASLTERQRRSYLRKLDRGDEEGAAKVLERAKNAGRGLGDDFDDFDDFLSDEEE